MTALFAIALYVLSTTPAEPPGTVSGEDVPVRVLLIKSDARIALELEGEWRFVPAEGGPGLLVSDLGEASIEGQPWVLVSEAGRQPLPRAEEVVLEPVTTPPGPAPAFGLGERRYRGRLRIRRSTDGQLRAINVVGLEDYLAGVIGHEMPLRWHDEAVKAQAIAARTYALRELKPGQDYDLESDTRSQVYGGVTSQDDRAQAMVRATQGLVVKFQGEMVTTYFHSTCGGDTIPASWVFPWIKADTEPLSGASECTCQSSRVYRWEKEVDLAQVSQLKVPLPLRKLEVVHWPRGLYVKELILTGADGHRQRWHGYRQARSYLRLRSPSFDATLSEDGRRATFRGRGWGHGVGMCQFGAKGFAEQGLSAAQIMAHFYPGAVVAPLKSDDLGS